MANKEHVEILKQGVEVWNKWRKENNDISPDLSQANFHQANLSQANLYSANFHKSYLGRANLSGAKLINANLSEADLSEANLNQAYLNKANLNAAKLIKSNLSEADLSEAKLVNANLSEANLHMADLSYANIQHANLSQADLHRARLSNAILYWANLSEANLSEAKLINTDLSLANLHKAEIRLANLLGANLSEADLSEADLHKANLRETDLRKTNFNEAFLTGANLYGAARFGWSIENVNCEYIYFGNNHSIPKNRSFEPGEFERLYRSIPTIEVVFEKGMNLFDPLLLSIVEQRLNEKHPKLGIELLSIDKRGLYPQAVYGVASDDKKQQVLKLVVSEYQQQIEFLKEDNTWLKKQFEKSQEQNKAFIAPRPVINTINIQGSAINSKIIQGNGNTIHQELEMAGITEHQLEEFVSEIRKEQELIKATLELQAEDVDTLKFALERLQPHLEKAFNQQFDTRGQKLLRLLSREVLKHIGGDLLGDQVNLEIT